MNTNKAIHFATALAFISIGFIGPPVTAKGPSVVVPALAAFGDKSTSTIGTDGCGAYDEGLYTDGCGASVYGNSRAGDNYFFRTVDYVGTTAQNIRFVWLNLQNVVPGSGQPGGAITDPNDSSGSQLFFGAASGSNSNLIPDMRLTASGLFSSTALARGSSVILVFSLQPEFTGSGDFELDFETNVPVTAPSAKVRVLTAGSNAVAALYVHNTNNKKTLVGRFYMPFSLTVTED